MSKKFIVFDEGEEDGIRAMQLGNVVVDLDIYQELDFIAVNFPTVENESAIERDNRFWDWYARRISQFAKVNVSRPVVQRIYRYLEEEAKKITDFFFPVPDSSTDSGKIQGEQSATDSPTAS